jgi:predicted  nucleic acid-binding Zn-ribbon protein
MSIDFGKKEAREGYLQAKLDDLLDGINSSYGQALLDELMSRLEATINDFNKEVDELMGSLKKSSEEKEKLIEKIKAGEPPKVEEKSSDPVEEAEDGEEKRDLSEWEKRLEGIS